VHVEHRLHGDAVAAAGAFGLRARFQVRAGTKAASRAGDDQ
jgi:hypothetical protein